ncbi:Unknown protein [Striga hermonthica]|uniref:SWIM-type domain-containing protein n=1 Tax=Striga hermonthica TaxID=68872 RepID=A0A9N7P250_STRHE|nr:Unknown protein [Striga hermonthica]
MHFSEDDRNMKFMIKDVDGKTFTVMHDVSLNKLQCSCKHFEMFGWLCRHVFVALKDMNIEDIPPTHIMSRWTKLAFSNPMFHILDDIAEQCAQIDEKKTMVNQLWSDIYICMGLVENNMDSLVEFSRIIGTHKRKLMENRENESSSKDKGHVFESFIGMSAPSEVSIHPPTQSKNKGSGKRMKSNKEKSIESAQKKQRLCKTCGERVGHDSRTCPKKP